MNILILLFVGLNVIILLINIHMHYNISLKRKIVMTLCSNNRKYKYTLIVYKTFTGCGLGNKIPTIISSIFFSIVSFSKFYIFGWEDITIYFKMPLCLLNNNLSIANIIEIRMVNNSIREILNYHKSISIYKYHGFMNTIYHLYNDSSIIKSNKLSSAQWNKIIQDAFFQPCDRVKGYLKSFYQAKENKKVVGVHIRTGFLSNLSKITFWYSPTIYGKYTKEIDKLLNITKNIKLLIISDSNELIKKVHKQYSNYVMNYSVSGPITDPHYSMHGRNYESGIKLLADNYLISNCDIAIGSHLSTYFTLACSRSTVKCIKI